MASKHHGTLNEFYILVLLQTAVSSNSSTPSELTQKDGALQDKDDQNSISELVRI